MRKMETYLAENVFSSISILHNSAIPVGDVCVCGSRGWFYDDAVASDKKVLLREACRLDTSITLGEKLGLETVVFLHYPPLYNEFVCQEIMEVLLNHQIKRCYYGHLHGRAATYALEGMHNGILFRLISADHLRFSPLAVD